MSSTAVVVTGDETSAEGPGSPGRSEAKPKRKRSLRVGLLCAAAWLVATILAAALANVIPIQNPLAIHPLDAYQAPTWAHWFGTDQLGRDQFARAVYGARVSLIVGFTASALAAVIGGTAGLIGGYLQGASDTTIMGFMDVLLAFPGFVLALALTSFLGASVRNVIIAITVLSIPVFARLTRSVTLSLTQRDFIQVAHTLGTPTWRVMVFELAPNLATTVISFIPIVVAVAIVVEGSLSFLGIGVPPPTPTWGTMISQGQAEFTSSPYMSLLPAGAMFVTILALNTVGRWLSRRFDRGGMVL